MDCGDGGGVRQDRECAVSVCCCFFFLTLGFLAPNDSESGDW